MKKLFYLILLFSNSVFAQQATLNYRIKYEDYSNLDYILNKTKISKEIDQAVKDNGFELVSDNFALTNGSDVSTYIGISLTDFKGGSPYIVAFSMISILKKNNETNMISHICPNIYINYQKNFETLEPILIRSIQNNIYEIKTKFSE